MQVGSDAPPYFPSQGAWIYPHCVIHESAFLSPGVCVGMPPCPDDDLPEYKNLKTEVGQHCHIGPYSVIYAGAILAEGVSVDPFCRVGHKSFIGSHTRILYGARIHNDVTIGSNCIIAGNCSDRVRIGDHVTHMGRIAHKYNQPFGGWAETEEPSPILEDYSIVGANALLIGGITVGRASYVAAGEIVRVSVPPRSIYYKGKIYAASEWTGSLAQSGLFDV